MCRGGGAGSLTRAQAAAPLKPNQAQPLLTLAHGFQEGQQGGDAQSGGHHREGAGGGVAHVPAWQEGHRGWGNG